MSYDICYDIISTLASKLNIDIDNVNLTASRCNFIAYSVKGTKCKPLAKNQLKAIEEAFKDFIGYFGEFDAYVYPASEYLGPDIQGNLNEIKIRFERPDDGDMFEAMSIAMKTL